MQRDTAHSLSAMLTDAIALSQSLLSGDLTEARFRANLMAREPQPKLVDLADAAAVVAHMLGVPGMVALDGIALAMLALADALAEVLPPSA